MKRHHLLLSALLCTLFALTTYAAYVTRIPVVVRQPDGTGVHCFASGDEFHNWLHDGNDYTIMQDPRTGVYVYAALEAGQLRPTAFMPGKDDPSREGLTPRVNITAEQWNKRRATFLAAIPPDLVATSTTGTINNIVVFIRFADESKSVYPDSIGRYERVFNSPGDGANSLFNYYREVSYGQLEVRSSFYPVTRDSVLSCQANPTPPTQLRL